MQAVFILALFSSVLAIMATVIGSGTSGASQLTAERIVEARDLLKGMSKVVLSDITRQYLHANPDGHTDIGDYIRSNTALSQMSSGRYANPAADPWGTEINGRIFTEYQNILPATGGINVAAPITGIAFVSAGPDRILQTTLPKVTTLSQIIGISAPAGSDDIVLTFTNRKAQEEQFAAMQAGLRRIGTAATKHLQVEVSNYRQFKLAQYQVSVTAGIEVSVSAINITTDPKAPRFLKLDNTSTGLANRRLLGVDGEFTALERTVGTGTNKGNMVISTTTPALLSDPLVIYLRNSAKPTSWGNPRSSFVYKLEVNAIE